MTDAHLSQSYENIQKRESEDLLEWTSCLQLIFFFLICLTRISLVHIKRTQKHKTIPSEMHSTYTICLPTHLILSFPKGFHGIEYFCNTSSLLLKY